MTMKTMKVTMKVNHKVKVRARAVEVEAEAEVEADVVGVEVVEDEVAEKVDAVVEKWKISQS